MKSSFVRRHKQPLLALLAGAILLLFGTVRVFASLPQDANFLIGTFLAVLLLWLTVGFGWPSILCIVCLGLNPSVGSQAALQSSFGGSSFVFLLFTFLCTYALTQTGFIPRVSLAFIKSKRAQKSPFQFGLQLFLAALVLGCFLSPSVLFFSMFPILKGIYAQLGLQKGDRYASFLLVGLVGTVSIASGMTPISHAFPVAALGIYQSVTGATVPYASYIAIALPAGVALFCVFVGLLFVAFQPNRSGVQASAQAASAPLAPWDSREKSILAIFAGVIALWVLPSILKQLLASSHPAFDMFGTALPPMMGTILLCLIQLDGAPLLQLKDGFSKGISWPTLLMSASAGGLATALTNPALGVQQAITQGVMPLVQGWAPLCLVGVFVVWGAVQSNLTAHLLTAQLVTAISLPILQTNPAIALGQMVPLLAFASSVGFAMPSAMPYIAEAQTSGWTTAKDIRRVGLPMLLATLACCFCIAYPIALLQG